MPKEVFWDSLEYSTRVRRVGDVVLLMEDEILKGPRSPIIFSSTNGSGSLEDICPELETGIGVLCQYASSCAFVLIKTN